MRADHKLTSLTYIAKRLITFFSFVGPYTRPSRKGKLCFYYEVFEIKLLTTQGTQRTYDHFQATLSYI